MKSTGFDFEESAILDRIYGPSEHPKTEIDFDVDVKAAKRAGIIISSNDESTLRDAFRRVYQWKNPAAVALGRLGGSVKSDKKSKSSAANGALGGRPRKTPPASK